MHEQISNFLAERIAVNDFPSAVYLVAEKGEIVYQDALGYAVVEPERIEARLDTIYDLASLTKVLVTGLLAAVLVDDGELSDENVVSDFIRTRTNWQSGVSVRQLLCHTSRLPAWKPFYLLVNEASQVHELILETESTAERGSVIYSDLNFIVLSRIVMDRMGWPLDHIAARNIFSPLGLNQTQFMPSQTGRRIVAASEKGNEYEKQTCIELGYLKPPATAGGSDLFRDYQIWGEVHDGNAWFMGGVAGHAGLFSTAEEVFKIALQFLPNYTQLLKPETCELFRTNFTKGMNEDRSFAFQLASTEGSTAGEKMSRESFGHNGFTGTSLWIDPVKERIFVLLTNRTHDHPLPFVNINPVRRRFHDITVELLDAR